MKGYKKHPRLTHTDYNGIKKMLAAGLKKTEICALAKVSKTTLSRVHTTKTFAEYKEKIVIDAAGNAKKLAQPEQLAVVEPATLNFTNEEILSRLDLISEQLDAIFNWINEQDNKKRGLFR